MIPSFTRTMMNDRKYGQTIFLKICKKNMPRWHACTNSICCIDIYLKESCITINFFLSLSLKTIFAVNLLYPLRGFFLSILQHIRNLLCVFMISDSAVALADFLSGAGIAEYYCTKIFSNQATIANSTNTVKHLL